MSESKQKKDSRNDVKIGPDTASKIRIIKGILERRGVPQPSNAKVVEESVDYYLKALEGSDTLTLYNSRLGAALLAFVDKAKIRDATMAGAMAEMVLDLVRKEMIC